MLRDFPEQCGLRPAFGVADQEYQLGVLKRLRVPEKRRAQVLALFSLYRLQGRPLGERGTALLARYQERLRDRNLADFDDLVVLTERLLRTDPAAAAQLRGRWDYVLVDEFQDLSPVQYGVVRQLGRGTSKSLRGGRRRAGDLFLGWIGSAHHPPVPRRFRAHPSDRVGPELSLLGADLRRRKAADRL